VLGRKSRSESGDATGRPGGKSVATAEPVIAKPGGKGRPTPKRREAETARKQRVKPPRDRKEAYRLAREQARADRLRQRQGLLKGDESALPPRDRGKARSYARDIVDSRRSAAEFFLPFAVVVLVVSVIDSPVVKGLIVYAWMVMLVVIIVDSIVMTRSVRRRIAERFPDEPTKGLTPYTLMRSLQMRRLRLPPPRVKPGARI
jgi:hypothetical protein